MTIDEVILLLKASQINSLTTLQEIVLRSAWEVKNYTSIALAAHDDKDHVMKVAKKLWQLLSTIWGESINESNFRSVLEPRCLSKTHQQLIKEFNWAASAISLEFPSNPVSLDSRFYIARPPVEELIYAEIAEPGSVICIIAPPKMGKSSLIIRAIAHAINQGFHTVNLDLQQPDQAVFASLDKFLCWLCTNISKELELEAKINDYWDENIDSKTNCSIYFRKYLLPALSNPLVLVLNELDWVFEYPEIAGEFISLISYWYEQAKRIEIWQKLRLILVHSTEIIVPLNLNKSVFNFGLPIKLPPFTKEQIQDLVQRHGLNWTSDEDVKSLMAMVGGHPYLIRLALYHLVGKGGLKQDLPQLLQQATTTAGIYHAYLNQYVLVLQKQPQLAAAFYQVITSKEDARLESVIAYKLQSMGLVKIRGDRTYPTCELYRLYFCNQLNNMENSHHFHLEQLAKENQQLPVINNVPI